MTNAPNTKQNECQPRVDCVKMMRDIRNILDAKFATMTWAEQKILIAQLAKGEIKITK
jgi:hypothetical protein